MSSYNFYPKTAKIIVNQFLGRGEGTQILSRIWWKQGTHKKSDPYTQAKLIGLIWGSVLGSQMRNPQPQAVDCLVNQWGTREKEEVSTASAHKMIMATQVLHLGNPPSDPHWRQEVERAAIRSHLSSIQTNEALAGQAENHFLSQTSKLPTNT